MKIRLGAFQTNSSSMHSIVVGDDRYGDLEVKKEVSKNVTVFKIPTYLEDDRKDFAFDWGYEEYTDIPTKLAYSYLWNSFRDRKDRIQYLELLVIAKLRTQGYSKVKEIRWEYDLDASSIDHQSLYDDNLGYDTVDPNFIFGISGRLVISNDNIGPNVDLMEAFYKVKEELENS